MTKSIAKKSTTGSLPPAVPLAITPTFSPCTHTSDDSYIYQLSLVLATATVSLCTVCGFTTGYLDRMDFNYSVRCSTTHEYVFAYSYILGNDGHARSHGGRQPAAVKPVFCMYVSKWAETSYVYTCIHISVHARMRWGWGHPALGASPFSPRGPTGERILLLAATTVSSCTSSTILDKPLGHSAKSSFANEKGSSLRCAMCQTRKWWRSCREGCRGTNARHLIGSNFGKNS